MLSSPPCLYSKLHAYLFKRHTILCTLPGYEYILSGQKIFGQELLQRSAQICFVSVYSCGIKSPVTSSQGSIHSSIDVLRTIQLVGPQTQNGHVSPRIQDNRLIGGWGGHLVWNAITFFVTGLDYLHQRNNGRKKQIDEKINIFYISYLYVCIRTSTSYNVTMLLITLHIHIKEH